MNYEYLSCVEHYFTLANQIQVVEIISTKIIRFLYTDLLYHDISRATFGA